MASKVPVCYCRVDSTSFCQQFYHFLEEETKGEEMIYWLVFPWVQNHPNKKISYPVLHVTALLSLSYVVM